MDPKNLLLMAGGAAVIFLGLLIVLTLTAKLVHRFYVKVAPNEVLVISGGKFNIGGQEYGYRLVTGGSTFVVPLFRRVDMMQLNAFQLKLQANNVPSIEGVRVTVFAVASVKIGTEEMMLRNAVHRFLGKDLSHIGMFAKEALEGSLRGVVAKLTVEELVKDRQKFSAEVQEQVTPDLRKLGLVLDNFLIQDISDSEHYIDALGAKRTAEVKRDAAIAEAESKRDEEIRVSEALREAKIKGSEARRAGDVAEAGALEATSNANRQREIVEARNKSQVMAEQNKAPLIGQQAAAEEDKKLRVLKVQAEEAEVIARIGLQEREKALNNARYEATVLVEAQKKAEAEVISSEGRRKALVVAAEATRESETIKAQGEKAAAADRAEAKFIMAQREAEAERLKVEQIGLGQKTAQVAKAEGQKAAAEATQKELEAKAAGLKAEMLAQADGLRAEKLAEAEGIRMRLLAEAEGVRQLGIAQAEALNKKAMAFSELGDAGKLLEVLDRLPPILGAAGKAAGEVVTPLADAMGKGLANIDEIRIIDMGGGQGGQSAVDRFTRGIPANVFAALESAKAMGLGPVVAEIARKFNIAPEALETLLHSASTKAPESHQEIALDPIKETPPDLRPGEHHKA